MDDRQQHEDQLEAIMASLLNEATAAALELADSGVTTIPLAYWNSVRDSFSEALLPRLESYQLRTAVRTSKECGLELPDTLLDDVKRSTQNQAARYAETLIEGLKRNVEKTRDEAMLAGVALNAVVSEMKERKSAEMIATDKNAVFPGEQQAVNRIQRHLDSERLSPLQMDDRELEDEASRKVGTPRSAETPAPVIATTCGEFFNASTRAANQEAGIR